MKFFIKYGVGLLALGWLLFVPAAVAQPEDPVQAKIKQETEEATATAYTVIFDNSGSMKGERIEKAKKAFRWWLSSVQPGNVWSLFKFSTGDGVLLVPFTLNGQDKVAQMITGLQADSNTPIVNCLRRAESQINKRKQTRPYERQVILVFTDGEENQDPEKNQGVVKKIADLRHKGIEVIGIGYAGAGDYMAAVASRYFQADDEPSLRQGLSKVEVEIDVMTPVNVTPEELQQLANPPAPQKSAVVQKEAASPGESNLPFTTNKPTAGASRNSMPKFVLIGVFVFFVLIVLIKRL